MEEKLFLVEGKVGKLFICYSASTGIVGKLIMLLTRGDITHAAIVYNDDLWGGWWVAEANVHGVHCRPMSGRKWKYAYEPKYDILPDLREAKKYIDEHYDFVGLLMFGWVQLWWRIFKLKIRKPFSSSKGQMCSEFAARVARKVIGDQNPQWVSPVILKKLMDVHSSLFTQVDPIMALGQG